MLYKALYKIGTELSCREAKDYSVPKLSGKTLKYKGCPQVKSFKTPSLY
ncbi:hypothetical protein TPE_2014 [Treponema pedis str. T A4]|uniref:Uncharacterized protein n=1 Tax=Treponema pedis str. T A4 TaxID=1291379 RepID=S6A141_9SPIR|nr:hypothetical protein TPE_2014 [Treponema pedis str. T A4]